MKKENPNTEAAEHYTRWDEMMLRNRQIERVQPTLVAHGMEETKLNKASCLKKPHNITLNIPSCS